MYTENRVRLIVYVKKLKQIFKKYFNKSKYLNLDYYFIKVD